MATVQNDRLAAADLLDNVADILSFVMDVSPALAEGNRHAGLSANGATGLALILEHVNSTIQQARLLI